MIATALLHTVLGERLLIGPLLRTNKGITAVPLARQVSRGAWHLTSLLMVACAAIVVLPDTSRLALAIIGTTWLASGLFDVAYTRGKHIGWPFLTAAGALVLVHITL